jgi:hypothetical protein
MRIVVLMKNMAIAIVRAQGGYEADCSVCCQKVG